MKYKTSLFFVFSSCFLFTPACEYIKTPDQISADFDAQQSQSNSSQNPSTAAQQSQSNSNQNPSTALTTQFPCKINADCVLVNKGCCGCRAGGESIAISNLAKDSHNDQLKKQCLELNKNIPIACPAQFRCDEFQAQCQNSQCVTIKKQ